MSNYSLSVSGIEELEKTLIRLDSLRFEAVVDKQLTQILNRARAEGGTPVDTGELRKCTSRTNDTMGYFADYAAHVEYGHRTVSGGYVPGQRYLMKNVNIQKEIYKSDLIEQIKKAGK